VGVRAVVHGRVRVDNRVGPDNHPTRKPRKKIMSDSCRTETSPGSPPSGETDDAMAGRFAVAWRTAWSRIAWLSTTRANARAGLVADVLASCVLLVAGASRGDMPFATLSAIVLCGLLLFTFVEYCFHRWLFHGTVDLLEQGHRRHHEQPQAYDSLPFFAPPLVALALAFVLSAFLPASVALLFTGGIAAGYAAYGLTHSIFHNVRFRHAFGRRWAAAHHIHHRHPGSNFGVTTPLWDIVLRTRYASGRSRPGQ
jgi:sterol desaturase/sphingolipid hydroxylase (fatty acid hydroxylase superfamily)